MGHDRLPDAERRPAPALPIRASRLAAVWAFLYALYRGYYAVGGAIGMHGAPVSDSQWRRVNASGAVILFLAAIVPIAILPLWRRHWLRSALLALCWVVAVGCVMHAIIDMAVSVLSLTGALTPSYPFWLSIDRRARDLQDLLFNEPWFLIEGLLWGAMAWTGGLSRSPRRWWWVASAVVAVIALTIVGLLSATHVIGRFVIG